MKGICSLRDLIRQATTLGEVKRLYQEVAASKASRDTKRKALIAATARARALIGRAA